MSNFLSVKEAAQRTGKSTSSIRRVIYPIIHDDQHPDRDQIQPGVDETRELRLKGENFAWRLSEELLQREVPIHETPKSGTGRITDDALPAGTGELLAMLRRELEIKNHQITQQSELIGKQMELISGLGERLREGNILLGSLQKQLTLPEGRARSKSDAVEAKSTPPSMREKGSKAGSKPVKPKKSWFDRLFP